MRMIERRVDQIIVARFRDDNDELTCTTRAFERSRPRSIASAGREFDDRVGVPFSPQKEVAHQLLMIAKGMRNVRKKAEAAQGFRALFSTSHFATYMLDTTGNLTLVQKMLAP